MLYTLTTPTTHTSYSIGDPLVAQYARAYVASKCLLVQPYCSQPSHTLTPLVNCFDDFLIMFAFHEQTNWSGVECVSDGGGDDDGDDDDGGGGGMSKDAYLHLLSPALQWLLQVCVCEM